MRLKRLTCEPKAVVSLVRRSRVLQADQRRALGPWGLSSVVALLLKLVYGWCDSFEASQPQTWGASDAVLWGNVAKNGV